MRQRKVTRIVRGRNAVDGAGVRLRRILGDRTIQDFDPFLMLDGFDSTNPQDYIKGFPWHPHRGIETVTYLVSGTMAHEDSLGNKGVIRSMGCQWMTAGSGIQGDAAAFGKAARVPVVGKPARYEKDGATYI